MMSLAVKHDWPQAPYDDLDYEDYNELDQLPPAYVKVAMSTNPTSDLQSIESNTIESTTNSTAAAANGQVTTMSDDPLRTNLNIIATMKNDCLTYFALCVVLLTAMMALSTIGYNRDGRIVSVLLLLFQIASNWQWHLVAHAGAQHPNKAIFLPILLYSIPGLIISATAYYRSADYTYNASIGGQILINCWFADQVLRNKVTQDMMKSIWINLLMGGIAAALFATALVENWLLSEMLWLSAPASSTT